MKIINAFTTDHFPGGHSEPERLLILADGRAVYINPTGEDIVFSFIDDAMASLKGAPRRSPSLIMQWADGYPIMSEIDIDMLLLIADELERLGASMSLSLVPGPSFDACVPEGYVRFVDDLDTYCTVTYELALEVLSATEDPRLIMPGLHARRLEDDGAALWFAKDRFSRNHLAGCTVCFHPLLGISANSGDEDQGFERYAVPG